MKERGHLDLIKTSEEMERIFSPTKSSELTGLQKKKKKNDGKEGVSHHLFM